MRPLTIATLCSGGEGVGVGARLAGVTHLWGIEYDDEIAQVARANGFNVLTADVTQVDPADFETPDILHVSPPCPSFSVAKTGGEETAEDVAIAGAVCRFIDVLRPRVFTLENVYGYRNSESWQMIAATLHRCGYQFNYWHLCAADYAVPQTRRRMVVIARRDGATPMCPAATHAPAGEITPMFDDRLPWVGWYEAIEDLIPTLPLAYLLPGQPCPHDPDGRECRDSPYCRGHFADWQEKRLLKEQSFMVTGQYAQSRDADERFVQVSAQESPSQTVTGSNRGDWRAFILSNAATERTDGIVDGDDTSNADVWQGEQEPVQTLRADGGGRVLRAFIVESKNANQEYGDGVREDNEPAFTVVTDHKPSHAPTAYTAGRVVKMTPRCLARFQSFPDWYALPDSNTLACRVIGNAVPTLLYAAVVRSLT